jgi:hypothetical protein
MIPSPPRKRPNTGRRSREHLTPDEVDVLITCTRRLGRHGQRDATMLLLALQGGHGSANHRTNGRQSL